MKVDIKFLCIFVVMLFLVPVGVVLANSDDNTYYGASGFYTLGLKGLGADYDLVDGFARGVSIKPVADRISKSRVLKSNSLHRLKPSNSNVLLDDLDQSQEKSDNYYKVYGDHWYAQSFKNTKGKLTKVEILINKHTKKSSKSNRVSIGRFRNSLKIDLLSKNKPLPTSGKIGNLTIAIRYQLNGEDVVNKTLSPDQIPKNGDGQWITFDFSDVDIWVDTTYYIVVYSDGGDEDNYYRWYYGDNNPYSNGYAQYSTNAGNSWNSLTNIDFCFRTYSSISGEEPDGVVERWALLVGIAEYIDPDANVLGLDNDAVDFKNVLVHHGWQEDHIKVLTNEQATKNNILSYLNWLDTMEDQDDIVIYSHSSHGGLVPGYSYALATYDSSIWDYTLDAKLDNLGSKNVLVVLGCCESGGFIPTLGKPGRVILTSSKATEYSYSSSDVRNSIFVYFLVAEEDYFTRVPGIDGAFAREDCDTNHDGWISAEEAFAHASYWTTWWAKNHFYVNQHPQKYDGYSGELKIIQI